MPDPNHPSQLVTRQIAFRQKTTTIRLSVGDESPLELIGYFFAAARVSIDEAIPGFTKKFMPTAAIAPMVDAVCADVHRHHAVAQPHFAECVK